MDEQGDGSRDTQKFGGLYAPSFFGPTIYFGANMMLQRRTGKNKKTHLIIQYTYYCIFDVTWKVPVNKLL